MIYSLLSQKLGPVFRTCYHFSIDVDACLLMLNLLICSYIKYLTFVLDMERDIDHMKVAQFVIMMSFRPCGGKVVVV